MAGEEEIQEPAAYHQEKILVSVRLRPSNARENASCDASDWECVNDRTIKYIHNLPVSERSMYPNSYSFDRVFSADCSTRQVYEEGAKKVALSVMSGINTSVFAYGQTSSGKTYTMNGVTRYAVADIYDYVFRHKEREFVMTFSAMEIYNESVKDLLAPDSPPLRLLDDPERGTVVEKITEETLTDWSRFQELVSVCEAQRQIGETSMNDTSSRSHQILRLTVESSVREFSGSDELRSLSATANFVDLAGSERASQTLSAGTRLKEGCHINRSLLTLGTVIRKLSKGRNGHIPFRDSKLTRILQSSLGGQARAAIICTMSPARSHVEQSRNTLLFASCAKEVATNARVNVVMSDKALVKQLQREVSRLEAELKTSIAVSIPSGIDELLGEKDHEIQKLKEEMIELKQQRDIAYMELAAKESFEEERPPKIRVDSEHPYPRLRVRSSLDESWVTESPIFAAPHCNGTSDRLSDSSEEGFLLPADYKLKMIRAISSSRLSPKTPNFNILLRDENEELDDEELDDLCKDVQCVDSEWPGENKDTFLNFPESRQRNDETDHVPDQLSTSATATTDHQEQVLNKVAHCVDPEGSSEVSCTGSNLSGPNPEDQKESDKVNRDFLIPTPGKQSSQNLDHEVVSGYRSLKLPKSRSCVERFMKSVRFEGVENIPSTSIACDKDSNGRPDEGFQLQVRTLKYGVGSETLTRSGSNDSPKSVATQDAAIQAADPKETSDLLDRKQLIEEAVQDSKLEPILQHVPLGDGRLDPVKDYTGSRMKWPSEFKRLQREIIELWHACNISLVHRTYFFLLFKGDPKDYIYMEVEHRRLSFLKDTFAKGDQTMDNGHTLSLASSAKALGHERHMLSHRMKKGMSKEERENIFLRWGIGLNTKHRRMQLALRLWTGIKDMDHIAESATIVSKLVRFLDEEKSFKEMFGLSFAPTQRINKKHRSLKRSVMSIL